MNTTVRGADWVQIMASDDAGLMALTDTVLGEAETMIAMQQSTGFGGCPIHSLAQTPNLVGTLVTDSE